MTKFYRHIILAVFLALFQLCALAQTKIMVKDIAEYNEAVNNANPGDSIVLKNGAWSNVELLAVGEGTKEKPISISAETPGKVIINGKSNLRIAGNYITVSGLWFKNGYTEESAVISFKKNNNEIANNCRLTDCTVSNYNPKENTKYYYLELWGKNNRVDHSNFTGKTNAGTTLVVWLKSEEHLENKHRIDHNYFGERPPLGRNGGETIRIGTSTYSESSSKTLVENNFFQKCNGEIEIISNKSGDNIFRNNLFFECEGTLTLRHGDRALVEKNVFLGNNKPETGGIRVINAGHTVINNLLVGLSGDGYRAPISVMSGIHNSPLNRYKPVKDVNIQNNTIINCRAVALGVGKDEEKTVAPTNVTFANNLITNSNASKVMESYGSLNGFNFYGNIVSSQAEVDAAYFQKANINWKTISSLPVPTADNPALEKVKKLKNSPEDDITGGIRENYVAGAFNLGAKDLPEAIKMNVGPSYKPEIKEVKPREDSLIVKPGLGTLKKALSKTSTQTKLYLNPGTYFIDDEMRVEGNIKIIGSEKGKVILKIAEDVEKRPLYFFRIKERSKLFLENLILDASGEHVPKYAVVSPGKGKDGKYSLFIDNCDFLNFTNTNGGSIYKAYLNTYADTVSFKNSRLENSYRGLNLSFQKDGQGKVNAQNIIIENTAFKDIKEFAINFYCKGAGCSSNNSKLIINQSVFNNVSKEDDGVIVKTNGIESVQISNTVFANSYNIKYPVRLVGEKSFISNSVLYDAREVKFSKGAKQKDLMFKKPKWEDESQFIPSKKSYLLKENNGIGRIGLLPNN
ncbi:poly(beta-D-mannuronate) lyase [Salegentibacter echinorum]|uniref:Poly(Beta-D-mannuronate) lyase n=1 Tax=Salegentibacter echinorum TaxID=1073325 RepID=A0A1M5HFH2_SALEC|nr:polysaccharide lyase 6 family protein [Salegentibacter echinorum]SHG14677.1 poly(beta-D-mannuronate) lyase [Salegentibacter echinorum]